MTGIQVELLFRNGTKVEWLSFVVGRRGGIYYVSPHRHIEKKT